MRNLFAVLLLSLGAGMAFANTYNEIPFVPMSPEVLGRGGSAIADAHGYDSLFNNPAGFSRDPSSMTLSSTSVWVYSHPDQFMGLVGQFAGRHQHTGVHFFVPQQPGDQTAASEQAPPGASATWAADWGWGRPSFSIPS